jgi:type I restriction enzyme S subunit
MRWCLRVKLAQNWATFGRLLLSTGDRPIVEKKVRRKDFWGATEQPDGTLVGMNVLGRLLMELREQLKGDEAESLRFIEPLAISEFLLFGQPIEAVQAAPNAEIPGWTPRRPSQADSVPPRSSDPQPSLFEQPMISSEQATESRQSTALGQSVTEPGRYPAYKAAKVHWLGEIPAHWSEKRGKYFFREIDERSQTGDEELLSVSHTTGVTPRSQKNVTMFKAESYVGHKVARPDDVVINTMWAWMSALGVSKNVGIVSPAYGVYRPLNSDDFLPAYADYLLRTPMLRSEYICRSTGIRASRLRLYPDEFLDIAFPCPPREEQERMVAFLRAKEAQVRHLIRNKRRLIGLLNEQKQAIINRAVTRGLNPDAPMKPTGIDWMPEVPAHWEVRPIKSLAKSGYKTFVDGDWIESPFIQDSGIRLIQTGNVGRGQFKEQGFRYISEQTFDRFNCTEFVPGDILICRLGDPVSRACLAPDLGVRMITSVDVCILKPDPAFSPALVVHILNCRGYLDWVNSLVRGSTRDRVSRSMLGSFKIPISPDSSEQEEIVQFVHNETKDLDKAIERTSAEISLIREYRERLIADVVTGKLDVRHIEIATPADEPISDEDDALEEELEADDAEVMEGADADD